ncbi:hypothetical protein RDI58_027111 [Solanum bulbocastanum]|uniref:Uncharacterized protein n=1 Tax=Solanum bulbocastanum TaxID=147425 RepID=A0AAN8Y1I0_SOLBU
MLMTQKEVMFMFRSRFIHTEMLYSGMK